jgi:hypothetical protein
LARIFKISKTTKENIMAEQQKAVYRSMQGKEVDMNKLMNQNELTVAVGNVKVNARGDELGPGGRIIHKHVETVESSQFIPDEISVRSSNPVETMPIIAEELVKSAKTTGKTTEQ